MARDRQILEERTRGDTLASIAERWGLSEEGVRQIAIREGTKVINDLEMKLLANRKTGDVELFLIPDHGGPDFDLAIEYFRWCVAQLQERGVQVQVEYRPVHNGIALAVSDVTPYEGASA